MSSAKQKKPFLQKFADRSGYAAEFSNIGIVIDIASKWFPPILTAFGGLFGYIVFITDPLIYFFRSLVRITRIIGRTFFGMQFDEEKHGAHPHISLANLASLTCFGIAIPLFFGLIISSPVGITIAWACALAGLAITAHFDYSYQAKKAEEKYLALDNADALPDERDKAYEEFKTARNAKYLFIALLLGLSVLLLCGSATAFAPAALVPYLTIAVQIASAVLAMIAVCRFVNWVQKNQPPDDKFFILNKLPELGAREKYKGRYICAPDKLDPTIGESAKLDSTKKKFYYIELNGKDTELTESRRDALINKYKLEKIKKYQHVNVEEARNRLKNGKKCYYLDSSGNLEILKLQPITAQHTKTLLRKHITCYSESNNQITELSATNFASIHNDKTYLIEPDALKSNELFIKIPTSEETLDLIKSKFANSTQMIGQTFGINKSDVSVLSPVAPSPAATIIEPAPVAQSLQPRIIATR